MGIAHQFLRLLGGKTRDDEGSLRPSDHHPYQILPDQPRADHSPQPRTTMSYLCDLFYRWYKSLTGILKGFFMPGRRTSHQSATLPVQNPSATPIIDYYATSSASLVKKPFFSSSTAYNDKPLMRFDDRVIISIPKNFKHLNNTSASKEISAVSVEDINTRILCLQESKAKPVIVKSAVVVSQETSSASVKDYNRIPFLEERKATLPVIVKSREVVSQETSSASVKDYNRIPFLEERKATLPVIVKSGEVVSQETSSASVKDYNRIPFLEERKATLPVIVKIREVVSQETSSASVKDYNRIPFLEERKATLPVIVKSGEVVSQETSSASVKDYNRIPFLEERKATLPVIVKIREVVSQETSSASVKDYNRIRFLEERKAKVLVNEGRWIKHYSNRHQILLVGEGDFSFSACLAVAFGCASNMIATSLDSEAFLNQNYKTAASNIKELRKRGCKVLHGIDATQMANHELLGYLMFDRIIFNFPFAGFFKELTRDTQLRRHRRLVNLFLKNAREMINKNGEIHVTHKTNAFHIDWNLEVMAASHELQLIESVRFNHRDYVGYQTKCGFGGDNNFNCNPSKTYKFALPC